MGDDEKLLHVITPCSRPENLQKLKACLPAWATWWVIYDRCLPQGIGDKEFRLDTENTWGKAQVNYALEHIPHGDYCYVLDDDNLLHPAFIEILPQHLRARKHDWIGFDSDMRGYDCRPDHIDQAQFVWRHTGQKYETVYNGDGLFAVHYPKHQPLIMQKQLAYYNRLAQAVPTFGVPPYDLTLITPTGGRPEALWLCRQYTQRQRTKLSLQWLVVDDVGDVPNAFPAQVLRPKPRWRPGDKTLGRNIMYALPHVQSPYVLFIEDDDWYAPEYCQYYYEQLQQYELFGQGHARYYNVCTRSYVQHPNTYHASLCQTGAHTAFLNKHSDLFQTPGPFYDIVLWRLDAKKQVEPAGTLCTGIKGLPGRNGLGGGHRGLKHADPDGYMLQQWVGAVDARPYLRFVRTAEPRNKLAAVRYDSARINMIQQSDPSKFVTATNPSMAGVYTADNQLVTASLLNRHDAFSVIGRPPKAEAKNIAGQYIYGGYLFYHFGHWITEGLSRLWFLRQRPHTPILWSDFNIGYFADWHRDTLRLYGLEQNTLVTEDVRVESLVVPSAGCRLPDFIAPEQVAALKIFDAADYERTLHLWLSRAEVNTVTGQHIDFQFELEDTLRKRGWTVISPENYSIEEQLQFFARSKVVAGFIGSAFYSCYLLYNYAGHVLMFDRNRVRPYTDMFLMRQVRPDLKIDYVPGPTDYTSVLAELDLRLGAQAKKL